MNSLHQAEFEGKKTKKKHKFIYVHVSGTSPDFASIGVLYLYAMACQHLPHSSFSKLFEVDVYEVYAAISILVESSVFV